MNPKATIFADEWLIDRNATQAAIRAGYSEKTAYSQGQRLLKNVEVQEYLSKAQEKLSKRCEIDQEYVIKGIVETIDMCKREETFTPASIIKGYELLGKNLGLFPDVKDHRSSDGTMSPKGLDASQLSDATLKEILNATKRE